MEQVLRKYKNEIQVKACEIKAPVRDITIKRYIDNMNKLMRDMGADNISFLQNYNKVFKHLDQYSDWTKKTYLNAIIEIMRAYFKVHDNFTQDLINKYVEKRDNLGKKLWEKANSNKPTLKDKDQIITFEEYDELIEKVNKEINDERLRYLPLSRLTKQEYNLMLRYMILCLYRYHPIRTEYAQMKVISPTDFKTKGDNIDKNYNYLVIGDRSSYIYRYKHKNEGTNYFKVEPKLHKIIKQYLPFRKNKDYLLSNFNGIPFKNNTLSKYITNTFNDLIDKPIGASTLRKIFITNKHGKSYIEQKKDAQMMDHSVKMASSHYTKAIKR